MFLYEPLNTLKPIADDLWIVDGPAVHMAVGPAAIPFPTRMTVVRLATGELFLHSPTAVDDALRCELEALGTIGHLVSPNRLHYAHIAAWKRLYPDAIAWASPGVRERAASQQIDVQFDRDLHVTADASWSDELDQLIFRGSRYMEEVVFFHRSSRALVLADLIENFERERLGWAGSGIAAVAGVLHPNGSTPRDLRLTFWGRKQLARASLDAMLAWKPERIIVSHGRWYEHDGEAELRRAFRWLSPLVR